MAETHGHEMHLVLKHDKLYLGWNYWISEAVSLIMFPAPCDVDSRFTEMINVNRRDLKK